VIAKVSEIGWLRGDLNHRPFGYEPSTTMLTHCDSIGPSTSPFQKMPAPTPGFGAKLVPSCRWLAGSLPQLSPSKKTRKIAKFEKIKASVLSSRFQSIRRLMSPFGNTKRQFNAVRRAIEFRIGLHAATGVSTCNIHLAESL
jgi:hypothetical protein